MKKWIAFALVCVMVLSLCACGENISEETQKKLDLYEKYEDYIDLLEDEKYEKLITKLIEKYQEQVQGQEPDDLEPTDSEPTDPPEPTQEEQYLLQQYYRVVDCLYDIDSGSYSTDDCWVDEYDDQGNWVQQHNGQSALQYCLKMLQELTIADSWTEWLKNEYNYGYEYNWNRQELLSKFSVVSDVILKQTTSYVDNMGNESSGWSFPNWIYDENGRVTILVNPNNVWELIESNPYGINETAWYTYDDNGVVTEVRYGYEDTTYYLVTPSYDAAGNKVSDHVVNNDGEIDITYTYNDQGQLAQISWQPITSSGTTIYTYNIYYTYDDNGNVVKEEKVYGYYESYYGCDVVETKWIKEYTYDANGHLATGSYTYEDWNYTTESHYNEETWEWTYELIPYVWYNKCDAYTYTCDAQGRVLTQNIEYGNSYYQYGDNAGNLYSKADYATGIVEYVYGEYVFYNTAK